MTATAQALDSMTLNITQEIRVRASLEATFSALLDEIGQYNQGQDGKPMPMKIEAWAGGRWYRDLGNGEGHLWGHVQAIKRPGLLEITGPLFISAPVVSNVQYRLSEVDGETVIKFKHSAFGLLPEGLKDGVSTGWGNLHGRVQKRAEAR
jgi:hypothetical protein